MPARPATDVDPASPRTRLGNLGPEVGALLDAARDLASTLELRPLLEVLLDHLKRLVDYAGTSIWELQGEGRLAPEREQELYRLVQEALNNVPKHAHARHVRVHLDLGSDRAVIDVADDGVGFEPAQHEADGYGLPSMRERVGATLHLESAPGRGTRVRVEAPR